MEGFFMLHRLSSFNKSTDTNVKKTKVGCLSVERLDASVRRLGASMRLLRASLWNGRVHSMRLLGASMPGGHNDGVEKDGVEILICRQSVGYLEVVG